jgi:lysophospholipase L1-like esterase
MKFAVLLSVTLTLLVGTQAFLNTKEQRKSFADAMEDPRMRELLHEHLANYSMQRPAGNGDRAALPDLGVTNYNCPGLMGPSAAIPTSAHSVRPADIKIVAALGDSLTAANGAGATNPLEVILQYRGLAFQIGGDRSLDTHVTVPNVLRKYNPQVFGASNGVGTVTVWERAQLNAGVPGAESGDLLGQARDLVQKMRTHPEVNVQNDWKLVSIFIGGNDVCAYCKDTTVHDATHFANNIKAAVQYLYDNLPRTIVSITGMFQMQMLRKIDKNQFFCDALHVYECGCEQNAQFTDAQMQQICQAYQASQMTLQTSGMFDQRDDFTVVIQPFLRDVTEPPRKPNGDVDLSFFAPDCFHFSQYGQAFAAKALWNNIVQAVGSKATTVNLSDPSFALGCPDPACPFIRTTKNSASCSQFMTPAKEEPSAAMKERPAVRGIRQK